MQALALLAFVCSLSALAGQAPAPPQPAPEPQPSADVRQATEAPPAFGLPLHGEEAEAFLRTAKVLKRKGLGSGVTGSDQVTLSDGTRTLKAVWKTIDEFRRGLTPFEGQGVILDYEDSYRFEIAAYELDKLLGLDLVPPTVERVLQYHHGSLQLWVEGAMTEWDRKKKNLQPPDTDAWNRQIYAVRLLQQLTWDWDSQNIHNVLIDPSFKVYAIDFSRSFAAYDKIRSEKMLERFPRAGLEAMKRLDEPTLQAKLGHWISRPQIRTLLKRRDQIVAIAERLVSAKGEAAVLY